MWERRREQRKLKETIERQIACLPKDMQAYVRAGTRIDEWRPGREGYFGGLFSTVALVYELAVRFEPFDEAWRALVIRTIQMAEEDIGNPEVPLTDDERAQLREATDRLRRHLRLREIEQETSKWRSPREAQEEIVNQLPEELRAEAWAEIEKAEGQSLFERLLGHVSIAMECMTDTAVPEPLARGLAAATVEGLESYITTPSDPLSDDERMRLREAVAELRAALKNG